MKRHIYLTLSILLAILIFYACSRNPVTGKKELSLMSSAQEQAAGDQADPSIKAAYGMYDDPGLQAFINEKGKAMGAISHRPDLTYSFRLLDSPVVNAFALPGGYVYFTRGIMAHFNNEAEFAGVLGHEIGHITARHSAKQQTQQTLGQLGFMVGIVASERFRNFANEAGQGLGLMFLKFGRDHESQSDKLGVRYSTMIGYDSHEMADFFNTLSRLSAKSGQNIPDFLSTHPNPVNRNAKVHEMSDAMQKELGLSNLKIGRNEYLNRIDGLIYGEDPRAGYVENGYFYHPELKFRFPVPSDWQVANSPQQVQMAPADGKALVVFTLSPEKTLETAAQAASEQFKLTVVEQQRTRINGFEAYAVLSDQLPQAGQQTQASQTTRIISYYIQKDGLIYVFHGVSEQSTFNSYSEIFKWIATNFNQLTDQSKINVQPTRIKIQTVKQSGTLQQAFTALGIASTDMEELSIVNGMLLNDQVNQGTLIKTFSKTYNSANNTSSRSTTERSGEPATNTTNRKQTEPATTPPAKNGERQPASRKAMSRKKKGN